MSCFLPVGPRDMWSLIPFSVANAFIATTKTEAMFGCVDKKESILFTSGVVCSGVVDDVFVGVVDGVFCLCCCWC